VKNQPLVSIIIPAYNAEKYIERSIDSALRQTYKNIEIIVVDDGSTDKTAEVLKLYNDPRIVYRYQKNQNQSVARNNGIAISKGEYVTFLDTDDIYLPEKVEKSVDFFCQNPSYSIAYCNVLHFFSQNPSKFYRLKYTGYAGDVLERLLKGSFININSIMISRDLFKKNGITFTEKRYYPEDYELYLRLALLGYRFGYIDSDLVIVEVRSDSITSMNVQVIVKKNTIEMIQRISAQMPERTELQKTIANLSKSFHRKLAIAHLMHGEKKAFFKALTHLVNPILKAPLFFLCVFVMVFPSSVLNRLIPIIWQINRKRHFSVVETLPDCMKYE
jgi:glycosyltransferase involved in cell wall biosynthesis